MCFVLDANSFHHFFKPSHPGYCEFEPLHNWLYSKDGTKMIYGGSVYIDEMNRLSKYRSYLVELNKVSKFIQINTIAVDEEAERIKTVINDAHCDDCHIIALLAVSGCLLFASHDKRADKYIKDKSLYPKHTQKRSIYRSRRHAACLTRNKIIKLQNIQT